MGGRPLNARLAYQPNCWGPHEVGVTSIGQLTYVTFGDMSEAIADIGAAPIAGVADAAAALSAGHLVVGGGGPEKSHAILGSGKTERWVRVGI